MKDMKKMKRFTKLIEQKFEELEMALLNISGKSNVKYNNNEDFSLLLEILKNRITNLQKEVIEKDVIKNFLLKQENKSNNNTGSVNKTVTENNEILESESGNSSPRFEMKKRH